MKKINIHNFWRSDAFIILMFAVMSVMSVVVLWHAHFVSDSSDLNFHWRRIYEIRNSIIHGGLVSHVSINSFNQTGSAVMSLYPSLNMYPMAILSLFMKSFVTLYYVIFITRNCLSLLIGYYACKSYCYNKAVSFVFSVAYTLSTFTLYTQLRGEVGVTSAIIFMPMVLFGLLNLLGKNKWVELTIGMSSIILCHILNTLIVFLFLFILIVFRYEDILNKTTLKALTKAILVTVLITGIFWIPFLILMFTNKIQTPQLAGLRIQGETLITLFSSAFLRLRVSTITLSSLVGLILGFIEYKKISNNDKKLLWTSIFFVFLSSTLFPWGLFHHTIVETTIQFTWRFLVVPNLLLSYLFSLIVLQISNIKRKIVVITIVTTILVLNQLMFQNRFIYKGRLNDSGISFILNNRDFYNQINSISQNDYYPKQSIKMYDTINRNLATYDGNKHIKIKLLGNGGYEFTNQARIKDLSLPFLYYNGINYQVKLDGKTVNEFANNNSLMTIKNVNKGHHHVRIIVHNTKMQIVSYITSLIGLIILLGAVIKKYIKRR